MICVTGVYIYIAREKVHMFLVGQVSGLIKHFNLLCPWGFTACAAFAAAQKQGAALIIAYYLHFYWRQSHQILHTWFFNRYDTFTIF